MKIKKQKIFTASGIIITALFYALLTPDSLGKEKVFSVNGVLDLSSDIQPGDYNGYYTDGRTAYYFDTSKLTLSTKYTPEENALISANSTGFAVYKKYGDSIGLYSVRGELIRSITTTCYPYMAHNYPVIHLIKSNASGFSTELITGGSLIKEYNVTGLITSISCDRNLVTAASFSDGRAVVLDREGSVLFSTFNSKSRIKVAKTVSLSDDGKILSLITGTDPQYVETYNTENWDLLFSDQIDADMRYSPLMKTTATRLYIENGEYISVYDTRTGEKVYKVKHSGTLIELAISQDGGFSTVSGDDRLHYIMYFNERGIRKYYAELRTPVSYITMTSGSSFYYVTDSTVVSMTEKAGI